MEVPASGGGCSIIPQMSADPARRHYARSPRGRWGHVRHPAPTRRSRSAEERIPQRPTTCAVGEGSSAGAHLSRRRLAHHHLCPFAAQLASPDPRTGYAETSQRPSIRRTTRPAFELDRAGLLHHLHSSTCPAPVAHLTTTITR